ncbi:MAG: HAMP domain-containing sensor histidine kinase [Planctomycetota bacterium]|nr:HAMP domain-containing sensor histidine kinase [Planctomycetota bacterium]
MRQEPALDAATALIDLLVRSTEHALRDRLVLETGLSAAATDSGALWRRDPAGEWRPSVERGRRGGRFEAERATRRALELAIPPALPGFSLVRSEVGPRGVALVLAGTLDEAAENALEALLACLSIVELAEGGDPPGPAAPLPAPAGRRDSEIGRIQHDVRNALTSLMATRQVLERYGADLAQGERQAFVEAVNRECERTGAILAQGLTGRSSPRLARATMAEIATDVLAVERAAFERSGCTLRAAIAEGARAALPACGPESWSRIVRNLLANAREAALARGIGCSIEVDLDGADDGGVRLRVQDGAGGLPEVPLRDLFEEGFTAGKTGGTGQGLGVVRALAIGAGGAIFVGRRPRGACFEVWMPNSPGERLEGPQEQSGECPNGQEKKALEGFTRRGGRA